MIKERIQQAALATCPQEDTDYREIYQRIRDPIRAQQHHDDVEPIAHHHHSTDEQLVADTQGVSIYDNDDDVRARHSCEFDLPKCLCVFYITIFTGMVSFLAWVISWVMSHS
jgi:hypothetical protein